MDPLPIEPLTAPPDAVVELPGSKSITNRVLVAAALAAGTSELNRVLDADDTRAMLTCLGALGITVDHDPTAGVAVVTGCGGRLSVDPGGVRLDARLSGTTSRFVLPVAALADAPVTVDGAAPLRARPMGDLVAALRTLGVAVDQHGAPGHLPLTVRGSGAVAGGSVAVAGEVSSQFLSGLLLAAPCFRGPLDVQIPGRLVSRPYVEMTAAVMRAFGAEVATDVGHEGAGSVHVEPGGYRGRRFDIEPDASAASYLLAAAVLGGGRVVVPGLGRASLQGDQRFVDVLARMGARVRVTADTTEVAAGDHLRGITVDLADLSDTVQTLAAVAVFADGPTTIEGVGFIRRKETDRIAAVVTELRRCGISAEELPDGLRIHPGTPQPAVVQTYDDHRMAMSFALLGLRASGIAIADPDCVAKTFPGYFAVLDELRR